MKKHLRDMALLLCAATLVLCLTVREGSPRQRLTTLRNEDLYTVMVRYGYAFPEEVTEEKRYALINGGLKKIVAKMEDNPQYGVGASYTVLVDLYEGIRDTLAKIYGWDT